MGYVACLGQIYEETAHVLQNLVSANGLNNAKNSVIPYLRVPRVRNGQCKQFHARLYPCQQPRKG